MWWAWLKDTGFFSKLLISKIYSKANSNFFPTFALSKVSCYTLYNLVALTFLIFWCLWCFNQCFCSRVIRGNRSITSRPTRHLRCVVSPPINVKKRAVFSVLPILFFSLFLFFFLHVHYPSLSYTLLYLLKQGSWSKCIKEKMHQEQILYQIIDVVKLLAKTGHPFRGH